MLNRSVCRKCLDTYSDRSYFWLWEIEDDIRWDNFSRVFCPGSGSSSVEISIHDPIPKFCIRKFEQAVAKALEESSEC